MDLSLLAVTVVICLSQTLATPTDHHDALGAHLDGADLSDAAHQQALFAAWKAAHPQVTFKDAQEEARAFASLFENAKKIKQHRHEHNQGMHTYTVGLNQFSHLTFDEFKATRLGHIQKDRRPMSGPARKRRGTPPPSVDYKAAGYTNIPKDQGVCGCCWTFATTGALEGAYFKKFGKLLSFSQQQLVECTPLFAGCDGGAAAAGIDYIHGLGGLALDSAYPYTSAAGTFGGCRASGTPMTPMTPNYLDIPSGDDLSLMNALASTGPIPTTIAVNTPFMSYTKGVINPATACDVAVNHAVLLVGYGKDSTTGQNFWLVKNSWGPTWGENGYFRLSRDVPNSCLIAHEAISVTI